MKTKETGEISVQSLLFPRSSFLSKEIGKKKQIENEGNRKEGTEMKTKKKTKKNWKERKKRRSKKQKKRNKKGDQ